MPIDESYRDKTFKVADKDCRIRNDDLLTFATYKAGDVLPSGAKVGDFKRIPVRRQVKITQAKVLPRGSQNVLIFAFATSSAGAPFGWTAVSNFAGKFVNETLGVLKPRPTDGEDGPNAAWANGHFLGQVDLVQIVDTNGQVKRVTLKMMAAYQSMVTAARADGVPISLSSGFRSFMEQKHLFEGFQQHLPGFNPADRPGFSKHQNGVALDIAEASAGPGNPTYDWMAANAPRFDFLRTVNREAWHWEHNPTLAATARAHHTFKTPNVLVP
jgi:hypothetical protein